MGLDAAAFKVATLTEPHDREECWESDHVFAFIIDDSFHRSARGLVLDRCYDVQGRATTVSNSYGGHGRFREELSRIFLDVAPRTVWRSPDEYAERPFFELIHFADNEGTIGTEAAADLARDFVEGRKKWEAAVTDTWNLHIYNEWTAAFEAASHGGLVRFA